MGRAVYQEGMRNAGRAMLAGPTALLALLLFALPDSGSGRAACPVTVPNGSAPPGESGSPDHHGNGKLWASLNRTGVSRVAPRTAAEYLGPGGEIAVDGVLGHDGSVGIKAPWWRGPGIRGRMRLRAQRLDAPAPQVDRTVPPSGYGVTGFQAMGLSLPSTGCWKVTGSVGDTKLTYVTLVRRAR